MTIHLDGESGEYFEIRVHERLYPKSVDYWDGNFLKAKALISVRGINASFNVNLRTDEFKAWMESFEYFFQDNTRKASLKTMEENVLINAQQEELGKVIWECTFKTSDDYPSTLSVFIKSSMLEVQNIYSQIKQLLEKYPVFGTPN